MGALGMIFVVVLAGRLLALVVLILRSFEWSEEIRRRVVLLRTGGGIPYGVAIAAGALVTIALQR